MRIMEVPERAFTLMIPEDRRACLFGLSQALSTIEFLDAAFDEHFKAIPLTRKKRSAREALFGLLIGNVFENEFGGPQDKFAAVLTEVLFSAGESEDRLDAVQHARRRWTDRQPPSDDSKPYQAAVDVILNEKSD